jgi:hypothetical protein
MEIMKKRSLFLMLGLVFLILVNLNFLSINSNNLDFSLKELFQVAKADGEGIPCGPDGCPYGMWCDGTICKWLVDQRTVSCVNATYCYYTNVGTGEIFSVWQTCNGVRTACDADPYGNHSCSYGTQCSCDPCN